MRELIDVMLRMVGVTYVTYYIHWKLQHVSSSVTPSKHHYLHLMNKFGLFYKHFRRQHSSVFKIIVFLYFLCIIRSIFSNLFLFMRKICKSISYLIAETEIPTKMCDTFCVAISINCNVKQYCVVNMKFCANNRLFSTVRHIILSDTM